jgi:hypothetical protein
MVAVRQGKRDARQFADPTAAVQIGGLGLGNASERQVERLHAPVLQPYFHSRRAIGGIGRRMDEELHRALTAHHQAGRHQASPLLAVARLERALEPVVGCRVHPQARQQRTLHLVRCLMEVAPDVPEFRVDAPEARRAVEKWFVAFQCHAGTGSILQERPRPVRE